MKADSLSHDIFLLMLNLSQIQSKEKILELFIDAVNGENLGVSLRLLESGETTEGKVQEISTMRLTFGRIAIEEDLHKVSPEVLAIIRNAVQMLAIILENLEQSHLLADDRHRLEQEITERKKAEQVREQLIHELQDALDKVKTLSGLIPICCYCNRIRDDKGYWNEIADYISKHSEAEFSHGFCPECAKKHYPKYYKKEDNNS